MKDKEFKDNEKRIIRMTYIADEANAIERARYLMDKAKIHALLLLARVIQERP
jgi:hypothetical protein